MAVVETRAITKRYEDHTAVERVDLLAREGELLVLLGPSGCGKTTLLRMLAGLETPSAGEVLIDGRVVTELAPRSRNVAMVFQSYALYPHLSVHENIAFPLRAVRMPRVQAEAKVREAAAMFGIERLLGRRPRQLSGGERQRVALARAVVREPVVFLLDEPLSNLDAKLRASARDELQRFQRRLGTTTVYVTHDQTEAMGLGDRVAVLERGRVRQIGTPLEVYSEPADTFVATFLGSPPMNLVPAEDAITGFRPEHLLPPRAFGEGAGLARFALRVSRVENLGADRLVYGTLEPPRPPARVISRLPATVTAEVRAGERHEFAVPVAQLRQFDRASGRRIAPRAL